MKAFEVGEIIEKAYPKKYAMDWDNVGLLIGDGNKEVNNIYITLDVTLDTVDDAIANKADMIVSHHPAIFSDIKSITFDTPVGKMIEKLIKNDIPVYSAHTNLDCGVGGLSDELAKIFGLEDVQVVMKTVCDNVGLGRIGILRNCVSGIELAKIVKEKLNTPVRYSGDETKMIKKVAVGSGASDDIFYDAKQMGADAVITGDCKYHRNQTAVDMGLLVIDAGHYPTEIIACDMFYKLLDGNGLNLIKTNEKDIFKFV